MEGDDRSAPIPHNEDAERALLGSVLLDKEVLSKVAGICTEVDFFTAKWASVYRAMLAIYERGDAVDYLTIVDELERGGANDGAPSLVGSLLGEVPTPIHAESYARIIANAATRRRLITAGGKILTLAFQSEEDPSVILERADVLLSEVIISRSGSTFRSAGDHLSDYLNEQEAIRTGDPASIEFKVPSGMLGIDKRMNGGLGRSDLTLLAARPGMGKSSLALSFALNSGVDYKATVAIFSLEMAARQLVGRMLAIRSGVPWRIARENRATDDQYKRLERAMGEIAEANIWIDETPALSISEMRSRVRQLSRKKPVDLIIIDHIQLVGGFERDTPVARMGKISSSLKVLAREMNVPVLALSQLSRGVDHRQDKRPILVDLRESGSLEQDADNVLFIYRESYYDKQAISQNRADIIIAKQRNGETGEVPMYWDPPLTRFTDLEQYR